MKHKKGFAAVLLTLIISALLSVSAFAASDGFSDVPEASPFYESVTYLAGRGITCGTGNGRYAPDTPITVRQWATMICRAFDKEDPFRILPAMAVMPVSTRAMRMDG